MTIWTDPDRIVLELDTPDVEMEIVRLEDGTMIAAWLSSQDGQPIKIVEPGCA